MARILWLPGVLRAAGLDVVEESGWKTRGRDDFNPFGIVAHATAGGLAQTNQSAVNTIINGRPGLSGPIGQAMIERGTGRWRVVASGAGNHAKTGWAGLLSGYGNSRLIGVECHHTNISDPDDDRFEPWSDVVYQSYVTGFAAICRHMGWDPSKRVVCHKEHQPGEKTDPTFNPGAFRTHVIQNLANPSTPSTPPHGDEEMIKVLAISQGNGVTAFYGWAYGHGLVDIPNGAELENWRGAARFAAGGLEVAGNEPGLDQLKWVLDKLGTGTPVNIPGGEVLAQVVANAVDSRIPMIVKAVNDDAAERGRE